MTSPLCVPQPLYGNTYVVSAEHRDGIGVWCCMLESRPGPGSFIRTAAVLPDDWNGILLNAGNGGMAGHASPDELLGDALEGYACVRSDLGTSRGVESGVQNPDVWKDFGWRATHIAAVSGKELAAAVYGKAPEHCYFYGISTGGQQALCMAQRFPEDHDAILAMEPASNRVDLHSYFLWNCRASCDAQGSLLFTPADIERLYTAEVRFFHEHGEDPSDDFVTDPWPYDGVIEDLLTYLGPGFSAIQLGALQKILTGPVTGEGRRIYNGMPAGSEPFYGIISREQLMPNFYPFLWTLGMDADPFTLDFDSACKAAKETLGADLDANDPDLRPFFLKGGKLILYSASSDPLVPYPDALRYYLEVRRVTGDVTGESIRFFMAPGKNHGSGGRGVSDVFACDGTRLITALRRWHEDGTAPDTLLGKRVSDGRQWIMPALGIGGAPLPKLPPVDEAP